MLLEFCSDESTGDQMSDSQAARRGRLIGSVWEGRNVQASAPRLAAFVPMNRGISEDRHEGDASPLPLNACLHT